MDENFNDILYEAIRRQNRKTNADRIRAMSDEELASVLLRMQTNGRAYGPSGVTALLGWLKQEVDNE